jgi:transposase
MTIATKEIRELAVKAYLKGKWSMQHVGELYGVHYKTIMRWVNDYLFEGRLEPRPRGHMSPAFSKDEREALSSLVEEKNDLTLDQLRKLLGKECTVATVHNTLKALGFKHKKKRYERVNKTEKT